MNRKNKKVLIPQTASDLRGAAKITVDAVEGVTDIVEAMHRNIARLSFPVGKVSSGRTRGITGLVYRSVRGVTRVVGAGLELALLQLAPLMQSIRPIPQRHAALSALNGVVGDYLAATKNPLSIKMQLRVNGRATKTVAHSGKVIVLVHGLCMNDLQWRRDGHDHGASLAKEFGYTSIYLHYNSGRPIAANGEEFAETLERMFATSPVPITELVIIGHSMGGLVARSACAVAAQAKHQWPRHLKKLIFLGTPHHGAPLERAGSWLDFVLAISPYSAPLARLGLVRSAGIQDLRHGNIAPDNAAKLLKTLPKKLPGGVKVFVIAATKQAMPHDEAKRQRLVGDGLVPVNSALGVHKDAALTLAIPASHKMICYEADHFDLLNRADVYDQIGRWLARGGARAPTSKRGTNGVRSN